MVKDRAAALNRAQTLTLLKRHSQQHLQQIERQIKAIDQQRQDILAQNGRHQARCDILVSIPGFNTITSLALLTKMPELGTLDTKQAASLAGLAPVSRQSKPWHGKSCIGGGRANLRQALDMPALVAIRFNAALKAQYQALRAAGKPAKVAIVATMRKLIILANAPLRDDRKWMLERA